MSLSEDTIGLLRDEAYLLLCRDTVQGALNLAAEKKDEVASTRPPFGVLARKKTREAFESSMDNVLSTEAALQNRVAKIQLLGSRLSMKLHEALDNYLQVESADYQHRGAVLAAIAGWESILPLYGEQLQAYARELRNTLTALTTLSASTAEGFEQRMHAFAELHLTATAVDATATMLEGAALKLAACGGPLFVPVRMPVPPFAHQVKWVEEVTRRAADNAIVTELDQVETAVRLMLGDNLAVMHAQVAAARALVTQLAEGYLETYWKQLREHAAAHYVEARDVDEVLAMLTERYIAADVQRRRERAAAVGDLYLGER